MKNKILLIIISLIVVSCSAYFDKPPTNAINEDDISSTTYPALRIGLYDAIQSGWNLFFLTEDNSSDNLVYRASYTQHEEIDNNQISLNNSFMNSDWGYIYRAISKCNKFIIALNKETDQTLSVGGMTVAQYMAEARAIRAYVYYKGITLWGDMPYLDENTTLEQAMTISRSPVADILPKMIADLKFAQDNSRAYSVTGPRYLSKESITALLARVYLYADDLPNARIEAEKVIASTSVEINDKYFDIWRGANEKEILFYIAGASTDQNSHGFYLRAEANNGRHELPVDPTLVADFALGPTDTRRATIASLANPTSPLFAYECIKYNNADNSDIWPVVRVAEMYLISAEASGYPAGLIRLNGLRAKRALPALTTTNIPNPTAFATAVMRERRLELCFEGHRFTDLKRMCKKYNLNIANYLPNITGINDPMLLYPVPQDQILINPNLTQNPGY